MIKRALLVTITFFVAVQSAFAQNFEQDQLPATLAKIKPSIVSVGTYMPTRSPRGVFLGTGFVFGNGTYIATNAHVVRRKLDLPHKEELAVFMQMGKKSSMAYVKKVAVDLKYDLAILKIKGPGKLPALKLGDVKSVREGQLYAFTGYPIGMVLGLFPVTHRGIISAITPIVIPQLSAKKLNPKLMKRLKEPYNVFQLDATAYPGNSGSPLYNIRTGEVIGIINKVFVKQSKETAITDPSGISYAIPINYLAKLQKKAQ